jgi:hypothetical protein
MVHTRGMYRMVHAGGRRNRNPQSLTTAVSLQLRLVAAKECHSPFFL